MAKSLRMHRVTDFRRLNLLHVNASLNQVPKESSAVLSLFSLAHQQILESSSTKNPTSMNQCHTLKNTPMGQLPPKLQATRSPNLVWCFHSPTPWQWKKSMELAIWRCVLVSQSWPRDRGRPRVRDEVLSEQFWEAFLFLAALSLTTCRVLSSSSLPYILVYWL